MKKGIWKIWLALTVCLAVVGPAFAGQIVAWGRNDYGQCNVPVGNDFVDIAAGHGHSLALRSDGSLEAWGSNSSGKCDVPEGNDFVTISACFGENVALKSDGSVVEWGSNGSNYSKVPEGNDIIAIAAGSLHNLFLKQDGSLVALGYNYFGQADAPPGSDFVAVAVGADHSVVLRSNGSILAWGCNDRGQSNEPAGNDFVAIASSWSHSLAIRADGSLVSWGASYPGPVPGGNDFVAIATGSVHCVALRSNGSVVAWGRNNYGQLDVPLGNDFIAIASGAHHSLAIRSEPAALMDIEIVGPNDVRENYQAQYEAVAYYDDGTTRNATHSAIWWLEPNTIASIDTNGLLQTGDIPVSEDITIFASYTEGGITSEIEKTVLISVPKILHVPTDYQTIQEAIDVARYSDTVVIADGIYTGQGNRDIDFLGKAITVQSESGPENCIIDCQNSGRGFQFYNNESPNSIVSAITITNGYAPIGGAILCYFGSPTIANCIITGNTATGGDVNFGGGGIFCVYGTPIISNCLISDNSTTLDGGGIFCRYEGGSATITNCTITSNTANNGGGIYAYDGGLITNSIIWGNSSRQIAGGFDSGTITFTDIQGGWPGEGNIDADPCFVEPGYWDTDSVWVEGDYHLLVGSPCIDAGTDGGVYTDIEGNIRPFDFPGVDNNGELPEFDMGAYEATAEEAELMILPRVINRRSRQRRIWAWVRLPEGITRDQIDSNEPLLLYPDVPEANGIEAIRQCVFQNQRRRSQRTSILAFFDKAELMDAVGDNDNGSVKLQVVGRFVSPGQYFYGSDTVRINSRRGRPREHRQLQRVGLNYGGEE